MERKLIVFDIDGTLVKKNKGKISPKTLTAINEAQKLGHVVSLASGRNDVNLYYLAKTLNINDGKTPIVGLNGAEVFSVTQDKQVTYLWERFFPREMSEIIIKAAWANYLDFFTYNKKSEGNYVARIWSTFSLAMIFARKARLIKVKKDLSNLNDGVKKFLIYGRQNRVQEFLKAIEPENFSIFTWSEVSDPKGNLEINMPGINKAIGIEAMAKILEIDQKNVVFFGDGQNDIAALKWAGTGVAMGNAHPGVAEHANEQTLSINDDGVAVWLEKNILGKKA